MLNVDRQPAVQLSPGGSNGSHLHAQDYASANNIENESSPRRRGPLGLQKRKEAGITRKIKACIRCRNQKILVCGCSF